MTNAIWALPKQLDWCIEVGCRHVGWNSPQNTLLTPGRRIYEHAVLLRMDLREPFDATCRRGTSEKRSGASSTLLSALTQQTWLFAANELLDVVVVLNNCDDHSAEIVKVASTRHDGLRLHVVVVRFPPPWAHVGSARRLAMERALNIGGPHSVLFSTDADAAPAVDWIEASLRSISAGADLVGGHIIGDKGEEALLGKGFLRRATHHLEYVGLVNHLKSIVDPDPHDPVAAPRRPYRR